MCMIPPAVQLILLKLTLSTIAKLFFLTTQIFEEIHPTKMTRMVVLFM